MIKLLGEHIIKKRGMRDDSARCRRMYGTLCSVVGILLNIFLFIGKYMAGVISGSVAITADAFNNLSDAGSSIITLVGFRLAGKKPDIDHPFGHGRIEYVSGFIVSMAILMMGFELGKSSIIKIFHPEKVETGTLAIAILIVSILVKLYMAIYNRQIGKKINSSAMIATSTDSLSDMCATTFVLVSMIVIRLTGVNLDGYIGVLVSLFILFAGYNAAKDTIGPLLGQNPDPEFVKEIEEIVLSNKVVVGIHDMVVHDYGPGRVMISLHAEVPGDKDIFMLHDNIDLIERELTDKLGCSAVIHMDPIETNNEIVKELKKKIAGLVKEMMEESSIHDFRMVQGPTHTNLIFDVVVPFSVKLTDAEVKNKICELVKEIDATYFAVVDIDRSYVN